MIHYTYDAAGTKRRVVHQNGSDTPMKQYCENKVYDGTTLTMILHETGYLTKENGTWKYFYYLKDHVGSNRLVLDDQGGEVQINNFYPYGLTQAEPTPRTDQAEQPYKFGGKELDRDFGVDAYDFEARMYNPAIGRFMTMDPLAEKYYSISPYAYCLNNPIRFIDPFGKDVWEINSQGEIINRIKDKNQDAFYMVAKDADGNYQRTFTTDAEGNKNYNSISFKYGTIESQRSISFSPDGKTTSSYDVYQVRGDANGSGLFEFMSNNVTGSSSEVEFSHFKTGVAGDKGLNFLTTSHEASKESGSKYLINGQLNQGYFIREFNHSHPRSAYPSGLYTRGNDIGVVTKITDISKYWQYTPPSFNIYHVPSRKMIPYTPSSQPHNFGLR